MSQNLQKGVMGNLWEQMNRRIKASHCAIPRLIINTDMSQV